MNMGNAADYRERIVDEAAVWFARMQDPELTHGQREAFAEWLAASVEHVKEYLALMTFRMEVGELQSDASIEELIAAAQGPLGGNVIAIDNRPLVPRTNSLAASSNVTQKKTLHLKDRLPMRRLAALAAAVIVFAVTLFTVYPNANSTHYRTGIGEQKSFPLPDGSVVTLNAASRIELKFRADGRDVHLHSGEALFDVAKDRTRPFRVHAGGTLIRAVGTRFNVYHRSQATKVTVVEGAIDVRARPLPDKSVADSQNITDRKIAPVRVTQGESAQVDLQSGAIAVTVANTAADLAWRERRLIFDSRALSAVVAEFNLYNDAPLTIVNPDLNDLEVSGAFYANDPRSFALFLEKARLAKTTIEDDGTIRIYR